MRRKEKKYRMIFAALLLIVTGLVIIAIGLGRYYISPIDVIKILLSKVIHIEPDWEAQAESVIFTLRLPRISGALLVGAALSLSGAAYQGVFKNPLVAPDMLGVSAGACVGASLAILMQFGHMNSLLGLLKYLADPDTQLASITHWQMGSLSTVVWRDIACVGPVIFISAGILIAVRWRINIMSLGEGEARSLGTDIKKTRGLVIICATALTASAVCISGTIGWIGLVIPHLGRIITGPDNRKLIPVSAVLGAGFLLLIDTAARNLTSAELPLSILTGLVGAPFYFYLLVRQRTKVA